MLAAFYASFMGVLETRVVALLNSVGNLKCAVRSATLFKATLGHFKLQEKNKIRLHNFYVLFILPQCCKVENLKRSR